MRHNFTPSIYFILDPACCAGRVLEDVLAAALAGGVTMVQYRDKHSAPELIKSNALKLQALCRDAVVPFLINDHVALAAEIGADGVHIGQGDMDPSEARNTIGADKILGLTAFTAEHYGALDSAIVDYVGTGPVYPTKTDKGKPVLGVERFADLVKQSPVPVVGIGGITPDNAADVMAAGANGVAMMRAISEADNIQAAAEKFRKTVIPAEAGIQKM